MPRRNKAKDDSVPRLPIEHFTISWDQNNEIRFKAPLTRLPITGNTNGIGPKLFFDTPFILDSDAFNGVEGQRVTLDCDEQDIQIVAAVSVEAAQQFLESCRMWTPILQSYEKEGRLLGNLWKRWMLSEFLIQCWIDDENRCEEDRRIIDRIMYLAEVGKLVKCVHRFENAANYKEGAPSIDTIAGYGARVGRMFQVLIDEDAELAAEKKLFESMRKKEVKAKLRTEVVAHRKERIKKLATEATVELKKEQRAKYPTVAAVARRTQGKYIESGEKPPGLRTIKAIVNTKLIKYVCGK